MELCGIDEAGRGPLAGPLVVAGVVLAKPIEGLSDSKKISEKKREELFGKIIENSKHKIVLIEPQLIDAIGLSKSIRRALEQIVADLGAERFLFDGNSSFGVLGIETMVKADGKIPEVMAASILAKVFRDRHMLKMAQLYPGYGFENHKGYGTKEHVEALRKLGPSPIHRKSFIVKELVQPRLL